MASLSELKTVINRLGAGHLSLTGTWYEPRNLIYYNIKMILEGIITRLRADLGCLKPEMVV